MSENIPYIIAENGYYYVAYKEKAPVPEIVVSSKGVANGLSEEYNDGWDFGPDSYDPTSTANPPYTQTSGFKEALNYIKTFVQDEIFNVSSDATSMFLNTAPKIKLTSGLFLLNSSVAVEQAYSNAYYATQIEGSGPTTILKDNTSTGIDILDLVGNGVDVSLYGNGYTARSVVSDLTVVSNDAGNSLYGIRVNRQSQILRTIVTGQFQNAHVEIGYSCSLQDSYIDGFNTNGITINGVTNYGAIIKSSGNALNYIKNVHDDNYYTPTSGSSGPTFGHNNFYASIIINTSPWLNLQSTVFGVIYQPSGTASNGYIMNINIESCYTNNNGGMPGVINWLSGNALNVKVTNSYLSNYVTGAGLVYIGGTTTNISLYLRNNQSNSALNLVISSLTSTVTTNLSVTTKGYNDNINGITYKATGTTAGNVISYQSAFEIDYKKVTISVNGYENDTTNNQTIYYPLPFSTVYAIAVNTTGLTITASASQITITAPDSTTTYSGIVIIEGY